MHLRETNTKFRALAERIAEDFFELSHDEASGCRILRFIRSADREISRTSNHTRFDSELGSLVAGGCVSQSQ
jgi:hypothetical protein